MSDGVTGDWVAIAVLGKPRGNRGEVTAVSLSSKPQRFQNLERVFLLGETGKPEAFSVEEVWEHKGALIFKFVGVDSISGAETLKGREVRVPSAERARLDPGEFFNSDLTGCVVIDRASGNAVGVVTGVADAGGPGLLELDNGSLVPFTTHICRVIDIENRRIEVDLPEGLLDINRP